MHYKAKHTMQAITMIALLLLLALQTYHSPLPTAKAILSTLIPVNALNLLILLLQSFSNHYWK